MSLCCRIDEGAPPAAVALRVSRARSVSRLSVAVWIVAAVGTAACAVVASTAVAAATTSTTSLKVARPARRNDSPAALATAFHDRASLGRAEQAARLRECAPASDWLPRPDCVWRATRRPIGPPRAQGRRELGAALGRLEGRRAGAAR